MKPLPQNLEDAIKRSISYNEIVTVEVSSRDETIATIKDGVAGHVDWTYNTDVGTDVWGWSDDSDSSSVDWRLLLV